MRQAREMNQKCCQTPSAYCLTSDATPSACAPQQYTSIHDSSVDLILFLPSFAVVMGSQ